MKKVQNLVSRLHKQSIRKKWSVIEKDSRIDVVMNSNKVNCMNLEYFQDVHQAADELEPMCPHKPVLLMSENKKCFGAGLDLKYIKGNVTSRHEGKTFVRDLNDMFLRWFLLNRMTIALIEGHAIAGGMVMALTNDFQVVKKDSSGIASLREVQLGVPFPGTTGFIVQQKIRDRFAFDEAILTGKEYSLDDAFKRGLFSHRCPKDEKLTEFAMQELGNSYTKKSYEAINRVKWNNNYNAYRQWEKTIGDKENLDDHFVELLLKHFLN